MSYIGRSSPSAAINATDIQNGVVSTIAIADGSIDLNGSKLSGTLALAGAKVSGTLPVGSGGTGQTSLTNLPLTTPILGVPTVNGYTEAVTTANVSSTYTFSLASSAIFYLTLVGNVTYTFPTAVAGKSFVLYQLQDATGSRTVTWPSLKWPGATTPTITSTASKADKFVFTCFDGVNWVGSISGQNY